MLIGALVALLLATVLYIAASRSIWLFAARGLQGLATGAALGAAGAAMLDLHPRGDAVQAGLVNGVGSALGIGLGAAVSSVLVQEAPDPRVTPFVLLSCCSRSRSPARWRCASRWLRTERPRLRPQRPKVPRVDPARVRARQPRRDRVLVDRRPLPRRLRRRWPATCSTPTATSPAAPRCSRSAVRAGWPSSPSAGSRRAPRWARARSCWRSAWRRPWRRCRPDSVPLLPGGVGGDRRGLRRRVHGRDPLDLGGRAGGAAGGRDVGLLRGRLPVAVGPHRDRRAGGARRSGSSRPSASSARWWSRSRWPRRWARAAARSVWQRPLASLRPGMFLANVLQPLISLEEWTLETLHSIGLGWGLAIVGLTLLVRVCTLPLVVRQFRSQRELRKHMPQMKALQAAPQGRPRAAAARDAGVLPRARDQPAERVCAAADPDPGLHLALLPDAPRREERPVRRLRAAVHPAPDRRSRTGRCWWRW